MLVINTRKNTEWIVFNLENGEKIKILVKDHKTNNKTHNKIVIECPKNIKVDRKEE